MEKEAEQQVGGRSQEGEIEATEAAGEGQERGVQDHLHRRDDVHEVGPAEDRVLPALAESEYRQVADQRAGDGTSLWRIEGERTGAVHVVPAVGEHT